MYKRLLFISIVSLLIACNSGGPSGEAYTIKMRLKQGDHFGQEMDMKMNMQAAIINMTMNMEMDNEFEVLKASPDEKELKMTYKNIHTSLESGPAVGKMSDSAINAPNRNIIGKSVILKLDKSNQIKEVTGFEEIFNASDSITREVMKKMFSKDQINNSMNFMFGMYPEKPVRVGETWKATTKMNMAGIEMTVDVNYELKSVKDGVAEIEVDGKITGTGGMGLNQANMNMKMTGDQTGTLNIKLADGYLKDGNYKMNMKSEIDAMGVKVPMDLKMDCIIKGS